MHAWLHVPVHKRNGNCVNNYMLTPIVSIGYLSSNGEPLVARKLAVSFEFGGKLVPKSTTEKQDAFSRLTWSPKYHAWQLNNHDVDHMISEGKKELEIIRKANAQQRAVDSANNSTSATVTATNPSEPTAPAPTPMANIIGNDTVAIVSPDGQVTLETSPQCRNAMEPASAGNSPTSPRKVSTSSMPSSVDAAPTPLVTPSPLPVAEVEYVLLSLQITRQKVGVPVVTMVAGERVVFDTVGSFAQYEQLKRPRFNLTFPLSQSKNLPADAEELGRSDAPVPHPEQPSTTLATTTASSTTALISLPHTHARVHSPTHHPAPHKHEEDDRMHLNSRFLAQQQQRFHDHVALHDTSGHCTMNNTSEELRRWRSSSTIGDLASTLDQSKEVTPGQLNRTLSFSESMNRVYTHHLGQSVDGNMNMHNDDRFGSLLKNVMRTIQKKDGVVDTIKKPKKRAKSDQSIAVINSAFSTATAAHSAINDEKDAKLKKSKSAKELKHVTISGGGGNQIQPSPQSGKKMRESLRSNSPSSPIAQSKQSSSPPNSPTTVNPRTLKQSDYQLDYVPHTASDRVYFFNSDAIVTTNPIAAHSPTGQSPRKSNSDFGERAKLPKDPYEMNGDEIFLEKIYYGIAKKAAKASSSSGSKKNLKPASTFSNAPTPIAAPSNNKTASTANVPYAPTTPEDAALADGVVVDPDRKNPECILF